MVSTVNFTEGEYLFEAAQMCQHGCQRVPCFESGFSSRLYGLGFLSKLVSRDIYLSLSIVLVLITDTHSGYNIALELFLIFWSRVCWVSSS